jgi:hypothetical protein
MLENGTALKTWALAGEPAVGETIAAESLPDHRTAYLDYSGPLAGEKGRVKRWDHGSFEWLSTSDDEIAIVLVGERASFHVSLRRDAAVDSRWTLEFSTPN